MPFSFSHRTYSLRYFSASLPWQESRNSYLNTKRYPFLNSLLINVIFPVLPSEHLLTGLFPSKKERITMHSLHLFLSVPAKSLLRSMYLPHLKPPSVKCEPRRITFSNSSLSVTYMPYLLWYIGHKWLDQKLVPKSRVKKPSLDVKKATCLWGGLA